MTHEQAIMKLKHLQFDPTTDEFDEEALDMAIEALTHFNSDSNSIKNELNDDLISRQSAIDAFMAEHPDGKDSCRISWALNVINELPSAQPERKGKWNVIQGDIVVCSNCGMSAPESMTGCLVNRHLEPNRTKFCPHCGADMRGE